MAVAQPGGALWAAVAPQIGGWIESDEGQLADLASQWTAAGKHFHEVLTGGPEKQGPQAVGSPIDTLLHSGGVWGDEAGAIWERQMLTIGQELLDRSAEMNTLARHVQAFADDVTYAKESILTAIDDNAQAYEQLALLPDGAGPGAQQQFATELAGDINSFLEIIAGQIAGRRPGVAPTGRHPTIGGDNGSFDDFGDFDEAADIAGNISGVTGAMALGAAVIPVVGEVAAPILGGISLLTGLFATGVHAAKAAYDPSMDNIVTVGGDALSLVPGVKALHEGEDLVKALSSPAQDYVQMAGGNHVYGRIAQGGTLLLPQIPSYADAVSPDAQPDLDGAKSAAGWVYGLSRVVDVISSFRK